MRRDAFHNSSLSSDVIDACKLVRKSYIFDDAYHNTIGYGLKSFGLKKFPQKIFWKSYWFLS